MRLAHEVHAALAGAAVAAFDDTFRVIIVVAVAGAALGLALRRPRTVPMDVADDAAVYVDSAQGAHVAA
jgi:hypothetical protein